MSTTQKHINLGKMVEERQEIKSRLTSAKNKLNSYRKTFEQTAYSITQNPMEGFRLSDKSDEFSVLSVPGAMGFEKDLEFPSRNEVALTIKEFICLKRRLDELNRLLS